MTPGNDGLHLAVEVAGLRLKNPLLAASGTFGYGVEYAGILDLSLLGRRTGRVHGLIESICLEATGLDDRVDVPERRLERPVGEAEPHHHRPACRDRRERRHGRIDRRARRNGHDDHCSLRLDTDPARQQHHDARQGDLLRHAT